MGQDAAETVKEIEDLRGRLESDLDELQARLPAPAVWTKRLAGTLVGGGVAASALLFLARQARGGRRGAASPRAIAGAPPRRVRPWLALLVVVPLLMQMAQLRELRRLRAEISGR